MLRHILGKLIAAPVRIINIPAKIADKALKYASNEEGSDEDILAAPLEAIAETIEETGDDIDD